MMAMKFWTCFKMFQALGLWRWWSGSVLVMCWFGISMESEAGILDPPLLAKFHPLRRLLYSSGHEPLHQCSRTGPEVTSTIPALILGWTKFHLQHAASYTTILVDVQPGLQELPTSINDLRAWLGFDFFSWARHFVRLHLYVFWLDLTELFPYFHTFFLVDDSVMDNSWHGSLVAFSGVSVQNDVAVLKPLRLCG